MPKNVVLVAVSNLELVPEDMECVALVSRNVMYSSPVALIRFYFQFKKVVGSQRPKTARIFNQVELKWVSAD